MRLNCASGFFQAFHNPTRHHVQDFPIRRGGPRALSIQCVLLVFNKVSWAWSVFAMCKFCLWSFKMSAVAIVEQSRHWARRIVEAESRGPGDFTDAIRRAARKHAIPKSAIWALFYRPPKDVAASVYFKLKAAHDAACENQMRKFQNELADARNSPAADAPLVRTAAALAGSDI